jgi:hypothetical protein
MVRKPEFTTISRPSWQCRGAFSKPWRVGYGRLVEEFLTETIESLDLLDVEIVRFEQDSNNPEI